MNSISIVLVLPLVDQLHVLKFIGMVGAMGKRFTQYNTLYWYAQAFHHMLRTESNGY